MPEKMDFEIVIIACSPVMPFGSFTALLVLLMNCTVYAVRWMHFGF